MPQQLVKMDIDFISLVDSGANKRRIALMKAAGAPPGTTPGAVVGLPEPIRKQAPSFASLMAVDELRTFLPRGLETLGQVLHHALLNDELGLSREQRAEAAIAAVREFEEALLTRVGEALVKRHYRTPLSGVLGPRR